jgi:hypothetical protein
MDLSEVRNIANVITRTVSIHIGVVKPISKIAQPVDGFKNGQAVLPSAAKVVDFSRFG